MLQSELVPRIERPVKAKVAGTVFLLDPQESGLTLDIEATVDEALAGGSWDPRHMLHVLSGGGEVSPVIIVESDEMRAALRVVQKAVKRNPVDATVSFGAGHPRVGFAVQGRRLKSGSAAERLRSALLSRESSVSLPLVAVEPDITSSEATRFVSDVAGPALSGPVRLRVTDTVVRLPERVFQPALRAKAVDDRLRLEVDAAVLDTRSRRLIASLPHQPVDARVLFEGDRTVIRPSRVGVGFSRSQWATALLEAVTNNKSKRHAEVRTTPTQPDFTTQLALMLKIETPVVSRVVRYEESVSGDGPLAARQLHRLLLRPGETVSLRDHVDVRRDHRTATLAASAMYEAAFRAGLTVVERTPSPVYVPSSTPGLDASLHTGLEPADQERHPVRSAGQGLRRVLAQRDRRHARRAVELAVRRCDRQLLAALQRRGTGSHRAGGTELRTPAGRRRFRDRRASRHVARRGYPPRRKDSHPLSATARSPLPLTVPAGHGSEVTVPMVRLEAEARKQALCVRIVLQRLQVCRHSAKARAPRQQRRDHARPKPAAAMLGRDLNGVQTQPVPRDHAATDRDGRGADLREHHRIATRQY